MASSLAARQAATTLARLTSSRSGSQAASFIQRRGLAGAADHHGPAKVNCWSDPMSPSKWKEEHFVIVSLSGWGLAIYGGYKLFTGGKKKMRNRWKHHNECGIQLSLAKPTANNVFALTSHLPPDSCYDHLETVQLFTHLM